MARSTSPLGPFDKLAQPIVKPDERYAGPGHVSITRGPDGTRGPGGALYIVYHAYRTSEGSPSCEAGRGGNQRRHALIGRLVFERGWPRVITP